MSRAYKRALSGPEHTHSLLGAWLLMLKARFAMVQLGNLGSDHWENSRVVRRAKRSLSVLRK